MAIVPRFRLQVSHIGFSIAFAVMLFATCNAINIDKLATWFRRNGGLDVMALLAYLLAGLASFTAIFTLFAHRFTIKPVAIGLTLLSGAATYFIAKYNVAIDSSMIRNALHTDVTEVRQLFSMQMIPYIVFLMVLPSLLILATDITFRPRGRYLLDSLMLVFVAMFIAGLLLYTQFNAIHRAGNVSRKYIVYSLVPVNLISGGISVVSRSLRARLRREAGDIDVQARVTTPGDLVVVLAIGESARRKNFSLYGYQRQRTNPELERIGGLHLLDGIAARGSTLYALPQILERRRIKLPRLVAKAGIPTACYVNYTLYDNCDGVGETRVSNCRHGKCYDEDVVPLLEGDLKSWSSGYRFIVLHLGGGSHGPNYGERHPPGFLKFRPVCTDADVANRCTLEQIYNSYDNSILYTDHVLGQIIGALDRRALPYVLIYVSDHGESLLENGVMFHGMPPGMALPPEQAQVPLIVKSSVPVSIVKRAGYPQQEVYDSVLDLFSIQVDQWRASGGFIERPSGTAAGTPRK